MNTGLQSPGFLRPFAYGQARRSFAQRKQPVAHGLQLVGIVKGGQMLAAGCAALYGRALGEDDFSIRRNVRWSVSFRA